MKNVKNIDIFFFHIGEDRKKVANYKTEEQMLNKIKTKINYLALW